MAIVTNYFTQITDGTNQGLWRYLKQRSIGNVVDQVETTLRGVAYEDTHALAMAEWIAPDASLDGASEFPVGEPFVALRRGVSEGYLIQVIVHNRTTGHMAPAITLKYLNPKSLAEQVTTALNDAFYEGLFIVESGFTVSLPDCWIYKVAGYPGGGILRIDVLDELLAKTYADLGCHLHISDAPRMLKLCESTDHAPIGRCWNCQYSTEDDCLSENEPEDEEAGGLLVCQSWLEAVNVSH